MVSEVVVYRQAQVEKRLLKDVKNLSYSRARDIMEIKLKDLHDNKVWGIDFDFDFDFEEDIENKSSYNLVIDIDLFEKPTSTCKLMPVKLIFKEVHKFSINIARGDVSDLKTVSVGELFLYEVRESEQDGITKYTIEFIGDTGYLDVFAKEVYFERQLREPFVSEYDWQEYIPIRKRKELLNK